MGHRSRSLPLRPLMASLALAACSGDSPSDPGPDDVVAPDFTLSAPTAPVAVNPGAAVAVPVTVSRVGGLAGPVTLSFETLPDGLVPVGGPATVVPGVSVGSLQLGAHPGLAAGSYAARIRGRTPGAEDRTVQVAVSVSGSVLGYDFAPADSVVRVGAGDSAALRLGIARKGGFSGPIRVSVDVSPGGVSVVPDTITVSGDTLLTVVAADQAPTGRYALRLTGSAPGLLDRAWDGAIVVTAAPRPVPVGLEIATLAAGGGHACEVRNSGEMACWGSDAHGQLGTAGLWPASAGAHRTPVVVQGGVRFAQVAAGRDHTCGLDDGGLAWCWGRNSFGQLGDGTSNAANVPVPVVGGRRWAKIVAGLYHTCALDGEGRVACWGANDAGQLGIGVAGHAGAPRDVAGGGRFAEIAAGPGGTCALDQAGLAHCWGRLPWEAGSGTRVSMVPTAMPGGVSFVAFAVGNDHACGLEPGGGARCIGENRYGQLGNGTEDPSDGPLPVAGGATFRRIAAGAYHTCAVDAADQVHCWGRNVAGELGSGSVGGVASVPLPVAGGGTFGAVALSQGAVASSLPPYEPFSCGRGGDGGILCWGGNGDGQLGTGREASPRPDAVARDRSVESWASGIYHSCLIREGGTAYCTGAVALGDGRDASSTQPVPVADGHAFRLLASGRTSTCGVRVDGRAFCWGEGALGSAKARSLVPVEVAGGTRWAQVSVSRASSPHACGVTEDGRVFCWGENRFGQVGDSTTVDREAPVPALLEGTFKQVVTGQEFSCALSSTGVAYCWGYNQHGSLGDGTTQHARRPVAVSGGRRFATLSARDLHVCGLDLEGRGWCWGKGDLGALGNGGSAPSSVPVAVQGDHRFASIETGGGFSSGAARGHTCGVDTDGRLWCWGHNGRGQLGDGTTTSKRVPVEVRGGIPFADVSGGGWHTCALDLEGRVYCWGDGSSGQFGEPKVFDVLVPKRVFH